MRSSEPAVKASYSPLGLVRDGTSAVALSLSLHHPLSPLPLHHAVSPNEPYLASRVIGEPIIKMPNSHHKAAAAVLRAVRVRARSSIVLRSHESFALCAMGATQPLPMHPSAPRDAH